MRWCWLFAQGRMLFLNITPHLRIGNNRVELRFPSERRNDRIPTSFRPLGAMLALKGAGCMYLPHLFPLEKDSAEFHALLDEWNTGGMNEKSTV